MDVLHLGLDLVSGIRRESRVAGANEKLPSIVSRLVLVSLMPTTEDL